MVAISGHYLAVDHGPRGVGFAVDLCGRNLGRLFTVSAHPQLEEAKAAAAIEAERRGGLEVEDRTTGAA